MTLSVTDRIQLHRNWMEKDPAYRSYVEEVEHWFKVLRTLGLAKQELKRVGWSKDGTVIGEDHPLSLEMLLYVSSRARCSVDDLDLERDMLNKVVLRAIRANYPTGGKTHPSTVAIWENKQSRTEKDVLHVLEIAFEIALKNTLNVRYRGRNRHHVQRMEE